jgi:hypothetical protein
MTKKQLLSLQNRETLICIAERLHDELLLEIYNRCKVATLLRCDSDTESILQRINDLLELSRG